MCGIRKADEHDSQQDYGIDDNVVMIVSICVCETLSSALL